MEHLGDSWFLALLALILVGAVVGWLFFNAFRIGGPIIAVVAAVVLFFGIAEYQGWINDNNGSTPSTAQAAPATTNPAPAASPSPTGKDGALALTDPRITAITSQIIGGTIKSVADIDTAIASAKPGFTPDQIQQVKAFLGELVKTAPNGTGNGADKSKDGGVTSSGKDQTVTCTKFDSGNTDNHVADGKTIPAGSCAIVEMIDFDKKTDIIFAGKVPADVTPGVAGKGHINAWSGFTTVAKAASDMCTSLIPERKGQYGSYVFSITPGCDGGGSPSGSQIRADLGSTLMTGTRLTGACDNPAHTDGVIRGVDFGATVSAGTLVVIRQVDNADAIEWIEYGCLLGDTVADHVGLNAIDIWTGYSNVPKSQSDACGQARADLNSSRITGSWNNSYTVLYQASDGKFVNVPATCPAR